MESGYLSTVHSIFESVDPTLNEWSARNKVPMYTQHRGEEVRTWTVVAQDGSRESQLWLELNPLRVQVWDFKKRRETFEAEGSLESALDQALDLARTWADAHTGA